jgi:amidophosphoribosyltransferase
VIDRKSVSEVREELGRRLARKFAGVEKPGVVFDVPSSAEDAAVSFAREADVPYRKGIRRNQYSQRSFIAAKSSLRHATVGLKFLFEKRTIQGEHVAVIDDSIVRGTTARTLVEKLRQHGAKKISFFSASPPVKHPCVYGIDMAVKQDLIASAQSDAGIGAFLGVDYLQYQTQEDLEGALGELPMCAACFTGKYPTRLDKEQMVGIEQGRAKVSGEQCETGVEQ